MKNTGLLTALILPAMLAVSCLGPDPAGTDTPGSDTPDEVRFFTAMVSAEQINPDAFNITSPYYFSWEEGICVSCYSSTAENLKMELVSGKYTYRGKFRGMNEKPLKDVDDYVIIYPWKEEGPLVSGAWPGSIPAAQTEGVLGSLLDMGMAAFVKAFDVHGSSETAACTMKRPATILRIPFTGNGETITSVTVKRQDGKAIAGNFTITDFETMTPVFEEGAPTEIVYTFPEPVTLTTTPQSVDVVIPAMAFEEGLDIVLNADDGSSDDNLIKGPVTYVSGIFNTAKTANFGKYLIWAPGYLMASEDGYCFSNSDVATGDRTVGHYFKYKSSVAIEAGVPDLVVNPASYDKTAVDVWVRDESTGKYRKEVRAYADIPSSDGDDPCARVAVAEGEPYWATPDLTQMQLWAKKDLDKNQHNKVITVTTDPRNRYNNDDASLNTGVKTIYGIYDAVTSKLTIYRSAYLNEGGDIQTSANNFCYMWYDTGSDTDLKIHRLAVNNSSAGQISANAGWACLIRCCREVDEIE